MGNNIVYAGYYDDTCVYVGEGKPDRYLHLNSGVSHVYEANYYHHTGKYIEVRVLAKDLSKEEALALESNLILELRPLWNKASHFGKGDITKLVEDKIVNVFGKEKLQWKSKIKQLEALRQFSKLLDIRGTTRVSSQQTKALLGCPRVMNRLLDPNDWEESKRIFNVFKIKSGLWEIQFKFND